MDSIEVEGKTVEEAIIKACEELQVPQERLNVEVISNGSSGMFGLMGVKKAKILARVIPAADEGESKGARAKAVLENILRRIDIEATVEIREESERIILDIKGDGSGLLIGRRGQTLNALQYIINKIASRDTEDKRQLIVDTESYRERSDRRIVHLALKDDAGLSTKSKGEGVYRRVVITPKKGYE
jgi:spoIIIJ-associated protein